MHVSSARTRGEEKPCVGLILILECICNVNNEYRTQENFQGELLFMLEENDEPFSPLDLREEKKGLSIDCNSLPFRSRVFDDDEHRHQEPR